MESCTSPCSTQKTGRPGNPGPPGFRDEKRRLHTALHGAGNAQDRRPGPHGPGAVGLLGIHGRRDRDLPRQRPEHAGGGIIGVVDTLAPDLAVKGHSDGAELRIEGIRQHHVVRGSGSQAPGIFDDKGVGQLPVFRNHAGAQGLADAQIHPGLHGHGGAGRQVHAAAHRRDGVGDGGLHPQRGIGGNGRLIDQQRVAPSRNADVADDQRWPGGHGRGGLQNAVDVIAQRALPVSQRIDGPFTEGVAAQIIRYRHAGDGGGPAVQQRHGVGHAAPLGVGVPDGGLGHGQRCQQFAGNGVGIRGAAIIGKRGIVGKSCHEAHS